MVDYRVKFRECGELWYGRGFPLRLKGAVYESYVRPAMLYGSEAWCLKEGEMGILQVHRAGQCGHGRSRLMKKV